MKTNDLHLEKAEIIAPTTRVIDIAKTLRDKKLRHVYVIDKDGPKGIVSITDINAKVVAEGKDPNNLVAKDIMTAPLICAGKDDDVRTAYYKMVEQGMFSMPIVDDKELMGVLSMNDAMKEMVRAHRELRN